MVNLSLPSLRIDSFSLDLLEKVQKVRKSGLTFAPEAGTQRLRDVINKGVTRKTCSTLSEWPSGRLEQVKLYMIGLPWKRWRTWGIAKLGTMVVDEYFRIPKEQRARGLKSPSARRLSSPSLHAVQWEAQDHESSGETGIPERKDKAGI